MTSHLCTGLQSAIVLLLPAAIVSHPAKFFNCVLHVGLTQELEISKEGSKSSSSLEKCIKLVHILRLINKQLSQGLSKAITLYFSQFGHLSVDQSWLHLI